MRRWSTPRILLFLIALSSFATPRAFAEDQVALEARIIPITRRNDLGIGYFFQDTRAVTPNGGSGVINAFDASVIGLSASWRSGLGQSGRWYYQIDGAYGIGSEERSGGTPPFTFTDKVTVNTYYGQAQLGYRHPLSGAVRIFASGGLKYSSTGAKFDDGTNTILSERFTGFGPTRTYGGEVDLSPRMTLRSEFYTSLLWLAATDAGAKYRQTFKEGCFRATLAFGF